MPQVTCRCGEKISVQPHGPERINCPKCGAKIRLRRPSSPAAGATTGDGFLRFLCPCGRRLKVSVTNRPVSGKCPNCGRVVPVPTAGQTSTTAVLPNQISRTDSEARTEELDAGDLNQLQKWSSRYADNPPRPETPVHTSAKANVTKNSSEGGGESELVAEMSSPASPVKFEAGLRVCPRCKKPVHLGASTCRECGTLVPRE